MQHKTVWMGHPVRLDLTREGLLGSVANYYTTWDAQRKGIKKKKQQEVQGEDK